VGVGEPSRDVHSRRLARRWGGRAVVGSRSCRFILGAVVGLSRSSSSPHIWGSLVFLCCRCHCDCLGVISSSWSWFSSHPPRPGCCHQPPSSCSAPLLLSWNTPRCFVVMPHRFVVVLRCFVVMPRHCMSVGRLPGEAVYTKREHQRDRTKLSSLHGSGNVSTTIIE
jgi:hypothetical protein